MQIVRFLLVSTIILQAVEAGCAHRKDCFSCTKHKMWYLWPCKWCPLTNSCHPKFSLKNHCLKDQNVRKTHQCKSRFHGKSEHYSPSEAYRLAEFSAIAYSDVPSQCMARMFPNDDYVLEEVVLEDCDDFFLDYDKLCSAILATSDRRKEIILSFRGTTGGEQLLDQVLTVLTSKTVHFPTGGQVQKYFQHINKKLYPEITSILTNLLSQHPHYEVKVTGHSLGGALASLTSALLIHDQIVKPNKVLLYTFGMPRVGDKRYAESHDHIVKNSWRVERDGDLVPSLPDCYHHACSVYNGPYHHATKVLYTSTPMKIHSNYILCKGNEDSTSECRRRQRYKRNVISGILDKHREYFNIRIGTHCRDFIMKQ